MPSLLFARVHCRKQFKLLFRGTHIPPNATRQLANCISRRDGCSVARTRQTINAKSDYANVDLSPSVGAIRDKRYVRAMMINNQMTINRINRIRESIIIFRFLEIAGKNERDRNLEPEQFTLSDYEEINAVINEIQTRTETHIARSATHVRRLFEETRG